MGDAEYEERAKNVQSYVPFLENIITQLKSPKMKNREQQLVKMESLYEMITDKRKKLKLETLIKCEDVIVKLYQKVKGEKGDFNAKTLDFEERKEKRKPPDIYSAAAQTLATPTSNTPTTSLTSHSEQLQSQQQQQPKSFFLRKPPISYSDLEILEKDVASELEKKLSLNELNNLRNSLCEQLDIDTTVRNKATLSKVVTTASSSPQSVVQVKKKDEKKTTTASAPAPKIIRESDELFGTAFQELDKKYASSLARKKSNDEDDRMALKLAEKAKELRNKKDKERRDRDKDKERKSSKDRDRRSRERKKERDRSNSSKSNRDHSRDKSIKNKDNKDRDKDTPTEKEKELKEETKDKDKKIEEVKPTLASSRDPRLKFGANVAVVTPRQTTPLCDRLAFKYNPKPRRDAVTATVVVEPNNTATTTPVQQQQPEDFFSPASPEDDVDKGGVVTTTLLNDPKVNDALASLKGLTTPRVYDDSMPPVLEYHGVGSGTGAVLPQNLNPPLLTPFEERPTPPTPNVVTPFQGYAQSPRYLEEEFYGRRFNVVQQQQQQQPQRFLQQQQQQQNCLYFPQQQQQFSGVFYQQKQQQQNDYFQQQQQQQQYFGGTRDPRMLTRAPYYQASAPPSQPQYYPPAPAPSRMTYKEYKEQRERELQRERDNNDASGVDMQRSRRDAERRPRSRSRERYRSTSRYRYERRDAKERNEKNSDVATTSAPSPLDSLYGAKSTYNVKPSKGFGANFKIPKKVKDEKTKVKIEEEEEQDEEEEEDEKEEEEVKEKVVEEQPKTEETTTIENKPKEEEESIIVKFFQNLIKTNDEELKKRSLVSLIESVPGFSEEQKKKITSIIIPEEKQQQQQEEEKVVEESKKKKEEIKEEKSLKVEEEKKEEIKEKKKPKTELDRLHEDIREMFIRDGVVTATGKRMCRLINASPKKTTPDVEMKELSVVLPKVSLDKIKEEEDERRYSLRKAASKLSYNEDAEGEKAKKTASATPAPTLSSPKQQQQQSPPTKKKKNAWATGIIRKKKRRKDVEEKKGEEDGDGVAEPAPAPHDRDYYQRPDVRSLRCKLCAASSRWISAHYRTEHPTSEVLSSRLSPDAGADAIRDSLEHDEYRDESTVDTTTLQRNIYSCRFCDYSLSASPKFFYDHVTVHTGEFRHRCTLCDYRRSNVRSIQSHLMDVHKISDGGAARRKIHTVEIENFTNLYGYLCERCNYTQLSYDALVRHVQGHKNDGSGGDSGDDTRIFKVKLNKTVVDVVEEEAEPEEEPVHVEEEEEDKSEPPPIIESINENAERRSTRSRRRKSVSAEIPAPTSKRAKIDVAVFTSNTDIVEENAKIEAERLKTMQSINETLKQQQQRNSLDIVEKLREKLQEEEKDKEVEEEIVEEQKKDELQMYEKIQQKSTHLDATNTSGGVATTGTEKPNRIISDVIEKLQGKLGAGAEIPQPDEESDDDEDPAPSPPLPLPPLVHVSHVAAAPTALLTDRGRGGSTLNIGAVQITKQDNDEFTYVCRASPCVYATRQLDAFAEHCDTEHAWNKTMRQYERCGECGAEFAQNSDRLTALALTHARQQHSEFFGAEVKYYGAIRVSSNLFESKKIKEEENEVKQEETETEKKEEEQQQVQEQKEEEENPFSFKIVEVRSLAEVPDEDDDVVVDVVDKPETTTQPQPEIQKKQRKSAKALKVFLDCNTDLFKCPEYDCSFTTNKRKMFDIHMTMHANQLTKFATCIYCFKYFTCENLGVHYEKIHGRCKYQCKYCLYRSLLPEYLDVHLALEHPDLPYDKIVLPKREEEKNLTSMYKEYTKTTLQPTRFACCDKTFVYVDAYEKHVTSCPKNPYFMCHHRRGPKVCMKIHVDVATLLDHWAQQHDAYPFKCAYCDVGRCDINDLMIHQVAVHSALPPDVETRVTTPNDVKNHNMLPKAPLDFERLIVELREDPRRYDEATRLQATPPSPDITTSADSSTTITSVTTYSKVNPSVNVVVKNTTPTISSSTATSGTASSSSSKKRGKIRVVPASVLKIAVGANEPQSQESTTSVPLVALEDDEPLVAIETSNNDVDVNAVDPLSLDVEPTTSTTTTTTSGTTGEKSGLKGHQLYRCAKCMLAFADHVMFKEHLVKSGDFCKSGDTAYKPYKCAHCGKYVKSLANLLDHLMYHGVVRFTCSLCDHKFPHALQARHHMKTKHNVFSVLMQPTTPGRSNLARDEFIVKPQSSTVRVGMVTPSPTKEDGSATDVDNSSGGGGSAATSTTDYVPKTVFYSHETDEIPQKSILSYDVTCGHCKTFKNKVRSNILRHLLLHRNDKEFQVPDIAPVNPVPCLEKNEKMFDKMYNLASSSHVGGRMGGTPKLDAKGDKKAGRNKGVASNDSTLYPAYVASTKRFQCCAIDCNYLCLEEGNLRHHLTALHQEELIFVCVHCRRDLSDAPDVDAILKHLKLHDLHLYKCSQCDYLHNLRHKVAKHVEDRHSKIKDASVVVIRAMDSEPYEETHYHHHLQHTPQTVVATPDVVVKTSKRWRCSMCKYRSDAKWQTDQHVKNKHDVERRFKCTWCSYTSDVETSFGEHFATRHPGRDVDVVAAYYEETPDVAVGGISDGGVAVNSDDVVATPEDAAALGVDFDTTPLWLRDKPRVRHIRGILLDETVTSSSQASVSPKKRKRSVDVVKNDEERRRDVKKIKNDEKNNEDETDIIIVDDDVDVEKQQQQKQRKKTTSTTHELDDIDLLCIYGDVGMPENDAFKCPKCDGLKTTSVGDFVRHVAKEILYERYMCEVCGIRFVTHDEATSHRDAQHRDAPTPASLKTLRVDKNKRRWLTMLVERQRAIIANLGFKVEQQEELKVKDFDEYFKQKPTTVPVENVVIDEQQKEKLFTKDKYRCDKCSAMFNSVPEFEFHAKEKHTEDVKYSVQAEDLTPIILTSGENTRNSLRCAYCPQTSSSKSTLEAHSSVQHPGLAFQAYRSRCAICDFKAETTKILRTHYRKLHPDSTELRYYDLSGKLIKTAGLIKLKVYRCPQCSYVGQSHNANNIRMHLRLHAKPFLCLLCDTEFKTRPDARAHHTREHPHNNEAIQEQPEKFAKIQELMSEIMKNVQEVEDEDDLEQQQPQTVPQQQVVVEVVQVEKKKKPAMFFARKSTCTLAPIRHDTNVLEHVDDVITDVIVGEEAEPCSSASEQGWSFYGSKPEQVDLTKITTNFEVADARMQMSCQQLARIYNLNPKVVVEKLLL